MRRSRMFSTSSPPEPAPLGWRAALRRQLGARRRSHRLVFQYLPAELDTLVADVDSAGPGYQPPHLLLALATEGAMVLSSGATASSRHSYFPLDPVYPLKSPHNIRTLADPRY